MSILESNKKSEIRFKRGDFTLYEPSQETREELMDMIEKLEGKEGTLDTQMVRFIFRSVTSLGVECDELTDDELDSLFGKGNRDEELFLRSIEELISEIQEDVIYLKEKQIREVTKFIKSLKLIDDEKIMLNEMNKMFKKKKINITPEDFIKYKNQPEILTALIEKETKKIVKKK